MDSHRSKGGGTMGLNLAAMEKITADVQMYDL